MPEELKQKKERFQRIRNIYRWGRMNYKPLAIVGAWIISTWFMILLYDVLRASPARITENQVKDYVASAMASATPPPAIGSQVFAIIHPSMVFIQTKVITTTEGKVEGTRGSGVVIDDNGSVLTSLHVVDKAIDIQVTFADGTQSAAFVLQRDPDNDLALLKPRNPPDGIPPAVLGSSGSLSVGDEVFAAGSPFGIPNSFSAGVVSGLNRSFKPPNQSSSLQGVIQFDAAVNPGNSGGPLLNRDGEVVGIVTGLVNPTDQDVFIGIGFAVPLPAGGGFGSPIQ
jgi:S1-C subfamily serine protease